MDYNKLNVFVYVVAKNSSKKVGAKILADESYLYHTLHFAFETRAVVDDVVVRVTDPRLPTKNTTNDLAAHHCRCCVPVT